MKSKIYFILSMVIFGTIGIFVRYIKLSSSEIALLRGFIGSLFLLAVVTFTRQKLSWENIKKNIPALLLSSLALGTNWIFLFQAYKHTTIANATLSYYFAPVFVIISSPIVLKEKISFKKAACICVAVLGMFFIVQSSGNDGAEHNHLLGILYGTIAAAFYATLMLTNKFIKNMNGLETTIVQLFLAAIILAPYVFITEGVNLFRATGFSMVCIVILGVIHTGIGFYLFFTGMKKINGQSIAALSYIDPITSLFVSVLIFNEKMTALQVIGAVLLLGSTFISEISKNHNWPDKNKKQVKL
ncbi:O-acetylserine/cysteine export protein [Oxobacter pfennigii]|uniref:O-acetylserine/cysteine export protein n=1 Tax=Oxobacter pfennigii TaxID=36849 RepID=A0A0N8NTT2_9CLOT|nr:DMT family transporter [Oxobacter pfennigii]KPU45704.1 O-acetylserine/cysteine export protein [Oxobacter pfennigii]